MSEQLPLFSTPAPETGSHPPAAPANNPAAAPPPASAPGAHGQAVTPTASLTAGIHAWREHLQRERTPENTVKAFIGDLHLAAQFTGTFESRNRLGTRDIDRWLN